MGGKGGGVTIPSNYTINTGGTGRPMVVDSDITTQSTSTSTSKSDSTATANLDLKIEPLKVSSDSTANVDLKVEPLKISSDSTSAIDVKPLAIDSCQTLKLAPLPPIKMEQPYSQHFGITFMGMELWGFNVSGKSETCLHSPPKPSHHSVHIEESCDCCGEPAHQPRPAPAQPRSGMRVRVK